MERRAGSRPQTTRAEGSVRDSARALERAADEVGGWPHPHRIQYVDERRSRSATSSSKRGSARCERTTVRRRARPPVIVEHLEWLRRLLCPYRVVDDWAKLGLGRVELFGVVESLETLSDPLYGQAAVVVVYRAWPPSTMIGVDRATAYVSRAFEVRARQAVDFLLTQGQQRIVVRADPGDSVDTLHRDLLARYGVALRAKIEIIRPGDRLVVMGRVLEGYGSSGSPMRSDPYLAAVAVEGLRLP